MALIGMSKETYLKILNEVDEIYYLIALNGRLASRQRVENILRGRHNLDFDDAQTFVEVSVKEVAFHFPENNHNPVWTADRPEPKLENYPEIAGFLKEE